jgi:cytochrome c-type biogenesis protein CcmE
MRLSGLIIPLVFFGTNLLAVEQFGKSAQGEIAVSGTVEKLCQEKGCWMIIKDGSTEVRVTFKDYGFFVKPSVMGKSITAQGNLVQKETSKAEAVHYLMDQGMSRKEAEKKGEAKKELTFVATGVAVKGV